jgi:hypothetical protein
MTEAEFLAALDSSTLPEPEFKHAGHVWPPGSICSKAPSRRGSRG